MSLWEWENRACPPFRTVMYGYPVVLSVQSLVNVHVFNNCCIMGDLVLLSFYTYNV